MRGLRGFTGGLVAFVLLAPAAAAKPGDLIVGDTGDDGKIWRVKPNGAATTLSNDPDFVFPAGTTYTASSGLFAADYDAFSADAGAIFRVNPRSGAASAIVQDDDDLTQPIYLDFHPNGFLYVPDYETSVLLRIDPQTGSNVSVGDFSDPAIDTPISLVVLPDGTMVSAVQDSPTLLRIQPTGSAAPIDVSGDPLVNPYGLGIDARGRVLIGDYSGDQLQRLNPRTGRVTELSKDGLLTGPAQPAALPNGKIAVANGNDGVVIVNPANGRQRSLVDLGEGTFAEGISVEPPKCFGQRANIVGTKKRDKLKGSRFRDVIAGLGGDDVIKGLGKKDRLCGNGGDDRIRGGPGRDKIRGGAGDDDIRR